MLFDHSMMNMNDANGSRRMRNVVSQQDCRRIGLTLAFVQELRRVESG